ncbi:lysophospholipid acyltransferase family protein [bacterium]|nr:lysophospholipid acyltransferase family protein [bacterium]
MAKPLVRKSKEFLIWLLRFYASFQRHMTFIHEINNKNLYPCIFAMWHSDQFCVFGPEHPEKIHILISKSFDGNIVSSIATMLNFKTIRGSSNRKGAIESTLKMIEVLEAGECVAITVDGPHGPLHKVKNGVIKIAQKTGAPIVPVCWYSDQVNFLKLPSWDKMTAPLFPANIINLYGDPIYVPKDIKNEDYDFYRRKIKSALEDIQKRLPEEYKNAKKQKAWKNLKKKG